MTKKIFIIGAGRSTSSLIKYLVNCSDEEDFILKIGDIDFSFLSTDLSNHSRVHTLFFDVFDADQRALEIEQSDLVISMLPAHLHNKVAQDCVKFQKSMVTASYVSEEIKKLHDEATSKGVLLLNEMGLDPGLDHMSAMNIIHQIKTQGGRIKSFKSFCGGLVAPAYDTNPWSYKFTWNPRNVVLAGQGVAKYIEGGDYKYVPYTQLFKRTISLRILDYGYFEAYANRDSLSYRTIYQLEDVPTLFRGTLRRPGFSEAWDLFVQLGLTDDSYEMNLKGMTYKSFFSSFLNLNNRTINECLKLDFDASDQVIEKLEWLGIFDEVNMGFTQASPAHALQKLLEEKWSLDVGDKDMIVMQHQFEYDLRGASYELQSSLAFLGVDQVQTAMAMTVGLPLAIAAKLILKGQIAAKGVQVPVTKEIYLPILKELETFGIQFIEESFLKV